MLADKVCAIWFPSMVNAKKVVVYSSDWKGQIIDSPICLKAVINSAKEKNGSIYLEFKKVWLLINWIGGGISIQWIQLWGCIMSL